jgi:broad specificity phosphatase PhoE
LTSYDELIVELFAHFDAGDRRLWTADQDSRPLSDLGRRQAAVLCEALATSPIDALYSSPALRCLQSIEPLAQRFGLPVTKLDGLHETDAWLPPQSWRGIPDDISKSVGGAYAAGLALQAIEVIRGERPTGRVATCTHGDVQPALVVYLIGRYGLELPAPNATRGGWYTLRFREDRVGVEHHDVLPGFPSP